MDSARRNYIIEELL